MNSLKPNETLQCQEENGVGFFNHPDKNSLQEKYIVGTFQGETSCLPYDRNFLEASAGNINEESNDAISFGGNFGHANMDNIFGGRKFRTHDFDDTQVVPDFGDLLETIHVDIDRTGVSRGSLDESKCCNSRARCDSSGRPKRRISERDELEIYFPCVLTPLPVDRLYSTLSDDATVFKFPEASNEFFANYKSKQDLSSEHGSSHDFIADDNRHSLDSFANVSLFSFSGGSERKFDKSDVTSDEAKISTRGKGLGFTEDQHQFLDSDQPCIVEQQSLPLLTMTMHRNKLKFQNSVTSSSCPEAIGISVEDENTSITKQYENPWQRSQTVYDLPVQLSNTLTSPEDLELTQTSNVNTDPSLNVFSLNDWRNFVNFDSPVENPSFLKNEYVEGGETSVKRSRLEYLALTPVISSIDNTPKYLCEKKAGRGKQSSICANFGVVKTETNQDGSDEEFSTKLAKKRSKSRNLKPGGEERGTSYTGNSRGFHNNLEKQRRINMKARFQNLRMTLPELSDNQRASKIAILRKALECIGMLEKESEDLEYEKRIEKLKNIELLNKLQNVTSGQS